MVKLTRLTHFGHAVRALRAAFGRLFLLFVQEPSRISWLNFSVPRPWELGYAISTPQRRLFMSVNNRTDDLASAVRYALETTRATAICPFHENVIIRVGDDDAEKHAYLRACNIVKSDGTTWEREVLREEIKRQLGDAADGTCPECAS
jgi:hypothetical protein